MNQQVESNIEPAGVIFHPAADVFPAMSEGEYRELKADINKHGQLEPIWVTGDDQVIDGRHRVKACAELGLQVTVRIYEGNEESIPAFVVSLNLRRRHLNESQRAMASAQSI